MRVCENCNGLGLVSFEPRVMCNICNGHGNLKERIVPTHFIEVWNMQKEMRIFPIKDLSYHLKQTVNYNLETIAIFKILMK